MRRYTRKKNSTKILIAFTIAAALIFGVSQFFFSKNRNDIAIAEFNKVKIYKSDVEKKLHDIFEGQGTEAQIPEISNLPKEVIEILAKEIYLEKELTKEAQKSEIGRSQEIKDRITDIQNKILRQAYVDFLVKSEITEQKISEKYLELSNELTGKKEYLVSHIVVKTKEEAEKISKEIKSKKSKFADEAKKYSIDQESSEKGGELGYILEDNMVKEISTAVANLQKDEVSAPIQTKFGWHLVKYSEVRDAKPLPFESVKENIREQLVQDKINEINASITDNGKVTILIPLKDEAAAELKTNEEKLEKTVTEEGLNSPEASKETEVEKKPATEATAVTEPSPESTTADEKAENAKSEEASKEPEAKNDEKSQTKTDAKSKAKKTKNKKHNR